MTSVGAFFDVDETVIADKSMFTFLRYFLAEQGEPASTYERLAGELHSAAAAGVPRQQINRRYYRIYAGQSAARLAAIGESWFAARTEEGDFFHEPVFEALNKHKAVGQVILVSGSFFACLDPIAHVLGADGVLSTRPVVRRGELTGEVVLPMIGAAKGRAVRVLAALRCLSLPDSSAYADHSSDLTMLEAVGDPVVVGEDPVLRDRATRSGWRTLAVQPARQKEAAI